MSERIMLEEISSALTEVAARTTELIGSLADTAVPIPGSAWTVREAAVHLVNCGDRYAGMLQDEPNGYPSLAPDVCAQLNDELIAAIPESDPAKLASLTHDAVGRLIDASADCDDTTEVLWHCGIRVPAANVVATAIAEHLVHGYDIALATRRPWPIDPHHAAWGLFGYGPAYAVCVNRATASGHTAGYSIKFRTGERFTARFVDGAYRTEPPGSEPIDCTITADPVAFLLVGTGRLSQWEAIALGLLEMGGPRPELGHGFAGLFLFP